MAKVRRLVLDTLKPHDPDVVQLAKALGDLDGVDSVNVSIYEIDLKVENVKVTLEGPDIKYDEVHELIHDLGGAVHSIDEVVAGADIIDDPITPQG